MGGGAAGGCDCEGDFNVVGADVGHGFGEPWTVDCELRFRCRYLVGWYLNFKRGAVFLVVAIATDAFARFAPFMT